MDIQRLRNLTTGRLHTEIGHVYQDIEAITGAQGIFTHQIPNAMRAMEPHLREAVTEPRFWDDAYDVTHVGEIEAPIMNTEQRAAFWQRYAALPSILDQLGSERT